MYQVYKITFKLLSPIHIGWKRTTNLNQTRFYVPGKTIWGALTARLTNDYPNKSNRDYKEIGSCLNDYFRFSYFYLADNIDSISFNDKNKKIESPWGIGLNNFAYKYISSYQSTALNFKVAVDGMLHEFEYISPKTIFGKQVYLIGYIFQNTINNNFFSQFDDDMLMNSLSRIQIGGERGYGWGKLELVKKKERNSNKFFGYDIDVSSNDPIIKIKKNNSILAHTFVSAKLQSTLKNDNSKIPLLGNIEPFVGRITKEKNKFGNCFSEAKICWIPGSKVLLTDQNQDYRSFKICADGLWSIM